MIATIPDHVHTVAALDVGKRVSGLAFFRRVGESWRMVRVGEIKTRPRRMATAIIAALDAEGPECRLLLELPVARRSGFDTHSGVEDLHKVVKALRQRIPSRIAHAARPSEWKRQVPKEVHWQRGQAIMSREEAEMFKNTGMDGKDAALIGMTLLGRMVVGGGGRA